MKILSLSLAALAVAGCTATADTEAARTAAAEAETELTEALRGRVAGQPVSCVSQRNLRGNRSAGDAIIFEGPGRVIYVNRPAGGCPELDSGRALVTRTTSTQLCRGDISTVIDPVTGFFHGSCGLGEFTPYRLASR